MPCFGSMASATFISGLPEEFCTDSDGSPCHGVYAPAGKREPVAQGSALKEVAEDLHELGKISGTGQIDVQLLWPAGWKNPSVSQYAGGPPASFFKACPQFLCGQRKFSSFVSASNDSRNIACLCTPHITCVWLLITSTLEDLVACQWSSRRAIMK